MLKSSITNYSFQSISKLLAIFVVIISYSYNADAKNLKEALLGLLEQHPSLKVSEKGKEASEETIKEAFSGYYPKLDLAASAGWERTDSTDLPEGGSKEDYSTENATITFTQPLFKGFATKSAVDSAKYGDDIADIAVKQARQQLLLDGILAYMNVLRFEKQLKLSKDNQRTLKTQLNLEDERVQRGSGIAVDVLQAKSRLQISKERSTAFYGQLLQAKHRYHQLFQEYITAKQLKEPSHPYNLIPNNLQQAIDIALENNYTLKTSKITTQISDKAITQAEAAYYPSLDFVVSGSYDNDAANSDGEENEVTAKLQASWNLFNGMADMARVSRAKHLHQSSKYTEMLTERQIIEAVKNSWETYNTTKERAQLLRNAVNIAGEVYEARKKLRDAGSETALNVLDAENELFRAKIDELAALYDHYNSIYQMLSIMGVLDVEGL